MNIKDKAKELCNKSGCHHKCNDTTDCVVEDEAKEVIANFATTKEKQIEKMAKIFCGMKNGCDECMWDKVYCNERNYAEEIYNAGYRKQIGGEWIVDAWDGEEWVIVPYIKTQHTDAFCSVCYGYALHNDKGEEIASAFCPHCGAKMKGGEKQ